MSLQTISLSPISPYSADPVGDAVKALVQVAPGATQSWIYWNDPGINTVQGTGLWQFKGCAYYLMPGTSDPVLYTVSCAGCATTSVGGAPAAPAPSFTSPVVMAQSKGPLFGTGLVPPTGRIMGMVGQIVETIAGTNPNTLIADFTNILKPNNQGPWLIYYNDPPTSSTWGTGIWRIKGTSLWANSNPGWVSTTVQAGGCSRTSIGGAPATPPPTSWGTALQVSNLFPFL